MSLMRPETVGSTCQLIARDRVAAPVRVELNTGLVSPVTVTVSATLASASANDTSCTTPSVSEMSLFASARNPDSTAVTVYGTADPHPLNEEPSVGLRDRLVGGPRRLVHGAHRRTRNDRALRVLDDAGHGARGHALRHGVARGPEQGEKSQEDQ